MNYIYIGEIINTHGLKGELKIVSEFKYKDKVFVKGMKFYVGNRKEEVIVNSYRPNKQLDMVTFEGVNDIETAITFKTDSVYINRDDVKIYGYFNEDLIGLTVLDMNKNIVIGKVLDVVNNSKYDLLLIQGENKNHLIPLIDEFVKEVSLKEKTILVNVIEGLIDEN